MAEYKMNQQAIDKLFEIAKATEKSYLAGEKPDFHWLNELWSFACDVSDKCCIGYSGRNVEVVE